MCKFQLQRDPFEFKNSDYDDNEISVNSKVVTVIVSQLQRFAFSAVFFPSRLTDFSQGG